MNKKVEFIESYIKINDCDYQWNDNHGELVRCKNCIKRYTESCLLRLTCKPQDENFYCADGEKKE